MATLSQRLFGAAREGRLRSGIRRVSDTWLWSTLIVLLYGRLFVSGAHDPESQFSTLWKFGNDFCWLIKSRQYFRAGYRQYFRNIYQVHWKILLFRCVVQIVKAKYPDYKPKILVRGRELIEEFLNSNEKVVVITIHNAWICVSIIRMLRELGISSSMIAALNLQQELEFVGGNFKLDRIHRSKSCLLEARQKLNERQWIVSCADETQVGTSELLMSTGIFDFAKKMQAQIIFAVAQVSNKGEIEIACGRPEISKALSANENAKEFIAFLDLVSMAKKKWRIGKWRRTHS
jgi:hypothetical protein